MPRDRISELTPREAELLDLMARGHSNEAIGKELCLSLRTVESHVSSIYRKLAGEVTGHYDRRVVAVLRYLHETPGPYADAA